MTSRHPPRVWPAGVRGACRSSMPRPRTVRAAIGLFSQMPIMRPCDLPGRQIVGCSGHAGYAQIDPICQNRGKQCFLICRRSARAIVGEAIRKTGPGVHLRQQVGDLDLWQLPINQTAHGGGGVRRFVCDRGNTQGATLNGDVRQRSRFGSGRYNCYGLL